MTTVPGRQPLDREPDHSLARSFGGLKVGDTFDYFDLKNVHGKRPDIPVRTLWVRGIKADSKSCVIWTGLPGAWDCKTSASTVSRENTAFLRSATMLIAAMAVKCVTQQQLAPVGMSSGSATWGRRRISANRDYVESKVASSHLYPAWRASQTKT